MEDAVLAAAGLRDGLERRLAVLLQPPQVAQQPVQHVQHVLPRRDGGVRVADGAVQELHGLQEGAAQLLRQDVRLELVRLEEVARDHLVVQRVDLVAEAVVRQRAVPAGAQQLQALLHVRLVAALRRLHAPGGEGLHPRGLLAQREGAAFVAEDGAHRGVLLLQLVRRQARRLQQVELHRGGDVARLELLEEAEQLALALVERREEDGRVRLLVLRPRRRERHAADGREPVREGLAPVVVRLDALDDAVDLAGGDLVEDGAGVLVADAAVVHFLLRLRVHREARLAEPLLGLEHGGRQRRALGGEAALKVGQALVALHAGAQPLAGVAADRLVDLRVEVGDPGGQRREGQAQGARRLAVLPEELLDLEELVLRLAHELVVARAQQVRAQRLLDGHDLLLPVELLEVREERDDPLRGVLAERLPEPRRALLEPRRRDGAVAPRGVVLRRGGDRLEGGEPLADLLRAGNVLAGEAGADHRVRGLGDLRHGGERLRVQLLADRVQDEGELRDHHVLVRVVAGGEVVEVEERHHAARVEGRKDLLEVADVVVRAQPHGVQGGRPEVVHERAEELPAAPVPVEVAHGQVRCRGRVLPAPGQQADLADAADAEGHHDAAQEVRDGGAPAVNDVRRVHVARLQVKVLAAAQEEAAVLQLVHAELRLRVEAAAGDRLDALLPELLHQPEELHAVVQLRVQIRGQLGQAHLHDPRVPPSRERVFHSAVLAAELLRRSPGARLRPRRICGALEWAGRSMRLAVHRAVHTWGAPLASVRSASRSQGASNRNSRFAGRGLIGRAA